MLPILTIFIVFLFVLTYNIKKSDAAQAKVDEDFWEKERASNAVRKQDISKLQYITIPLEKLPHRIETESEKAFIAMSQKTMVNLSGISNTDLKLQYGTANLTLLSEYDANFTDMIALLPDYATELIDAGESESAQILLEFAIDCKADSARIYRLLASIYRACNNTAGIAYLLRSSEELPTLTRQTIQKELS